MTIIINMVPVWSQNGELNSAETVSFEWMNLIGLWDRSATISKVPDLRIRSEKLSNNNCLINRAHCSEFSLRWNIVSKTTPNCNTGADLKIGSTKSNWLSTRAFPRWHCDLPLWYHRFARSSFLIARRQIRWGREAKRHWRDEECCSCSEDEHWPALVFRLALLGS